MFKAVNDSLFLTKGGKVTCHNDAAVDLIKQMEDFLKSMPHPPEPSKFEELKFLHLFQSSPSQKEGSSVSLTQPDLQQGFSYSIEDLLKSRPEELNGAIFTTRMDLS
jgi:hypothetical protein